MISSGIVPQGERCAVMAVVQLGVGRLRVNKGRNRTDGGLRCGGGTLKVCRVVRASIVWWSSKGKWLHRGKRT